MAKKRRLSGFGFFDYGTASAGDFAFSCLSCYRTVEIYILIYLSERFIINMIINLD